MYSEIKLEDVVEFLNANGYSWDKTIVERDLCCRVEVSGMRDLYDQEQAVKLVDKNNNLIYLSMAINNFTFKLLKEHCSFYAEGLYLYKDLSDKWVNFLSVKYGQKYNTVVEQELKKALEKANVYKARQFKEAEEQIRRAKEYAEKVEDNVSKLMASMVKQESTEEKI